MSTKCIFPAICLAFLALFGAMQPISATLVPENPDTTAVDHKPEALDNNISHFANYAVPLWRDLFDEHQPTDYLIFNMEGGLVLLESVPYEKTPSGNLAILLRKSELLFDLGNTKVYVR